MDVRDFRFKRIDFSLNYLILVTPPLKNVRKRRFRKVARQKTQDHDEIENEVRRLFRADNEANDVKWEIIEDDQEIEIHKPIEKNPSGKYE